MQAFSATKSRDPLLLSTTSRGRLKRAESAEPFVSAASLGTPANTVTLPALIILGYWDDFRYSWVLAIAGLGGLLGVLFSVPLRRSLIVEQGLAFPEGKAAAEVLKTGDNPGAGLKILAMAASIGGLMKLAAGSGLRLIPDTAAASGWWGNTLAYFGTNLSPALFGVGYIVGLNIGVVMLAGGVMAWARAIGVFGPLMVFVGTSPRVQVMPTAMWLELSVGNIEASLSLALASTAMWRTASSAKNISLSFFRCPATRRSVWAATKPRRERAERAKRRERARMRAVPPSSGIGKGAAPSLLRLTGEDSPGGCGSSPGCRETPPFFRSG